MIDERFNRKIQDWSPENRERRLAEEDAMCVCLPGASGNWVQTRDGGNSKSSHISTHPSSSIIISLGLGVKKKTLKRRGQARAMRWAASIGRYCLFRSLLVMLVDGSSGASCSEGS